MHRSFLPNGAFYLVTTGWIFDISLCENSIKPKRIARTPYSQGFRFLYRHSRRRLGSPWVDPINAALKRLKLATVTLGATSTLSRLFRFSLPLPVFGRLFIFLHPRGHKPTAPFTYCVISDGGPVPRDAKQPKILCHAVRPFFLVPPRPTFSRVLQLS